MDDVGLELRHSGNARTRPVQTMDYKDNMYTYPPLDVLNGGFRSVLAYLKSKHGVRCEDGQTGDKEGLLWNLTCNFLLTFDICSHAGPSRASSRIPPVTLFFLLETSLVATSKHIRASASTCTHNMHIL